MIRGPRFLPLACLCCSGDLAGRAVDRVAFCPACGKAFLCEDRGLTELHALHVAVAAGAQTAVLPVPFWVHGGRAVPAFLSARTLTLARVATRLLRGWPGAEGPGAPPPLGGRLPPEALPEIQRLAGLPAARTSGRLTLLAVPLLCEGPRFRLPGWDGELFADDVPEAPDLRSRLPAPSLA